MDTIPILSRSDIETKVEEVIEHFYSICLRKPQKTPIELICKSLNEVHKINFDFSSNLGLSSNDKKILGKFVFNPRSIFIDNSVINTVRFPFVLSHEIGHLVLHRNVSYIKSNYKDIIDTEIDFASGKKILQSDKDWLEWQANQFASSFIMPRQTVLTTVVMVQQKMGITHNVGQVYVSKESSSIRDFNNLLSEVAAIYDVNKTNVENRLSDLGLLIDHRLKDVKHISELFNED